MFKSAVLERLPVPANSDEAGQFPEFARERARNHDDERLCMRVSVRREVTEVCLEISRGR